MKFDKLLKKLQLEKVNSGACMGMNQWLAPANGKRLTSYSPINNEPIADVILADGETYEVITVKAQDTFKTWREVPAPKRGDLVRQLGNSLREHQEPLGELVSLEMGKILTEGVGEVQEMIDICDFATGLSRQLYGLTMHSERYRHRMYEQWHPLGPVGIVSAFNFPVAVWAWNAALAAVCGDTSIWKPSSKVPLSAVAVQHLANGVMADFGVSGVFNLVVGPGRTVGETMLKDPRIPLISFTGSTRMGRHVSSTVAGRFGRSILELGGNNAIIVSAEADLEMSARAIVFGAVGTAGQRCTSTRRILVDNKCRQQLVDRLKDLYSRVRIGNPLADDVLMGPLVDGNAVEEMENALKQATEQGGVVSYGGQRLPDIGPNYVAPVIVEMPTQTDIVCQETFAPILYVLPYDSLEEAMALHNAVPQGLSSAIFTLNMRESEYFLSHAGSDCGIANVNIGTSGAEIGGAFGGEKETGGGRESGSDAWRTYMRRQTNTINWSDELPLAQGIDFDL